MSFVHAIFAKSCTVFTDPLAILTDVLSEVEKKKWVTNAERQIINEAVLMMVEMKSTCEDRVYHGLPILESCPPHDSYMDVVNQLIIDVFEEYQYGDSWISKTIKIFNPTCIWVDPNDLVLVESPHSKVKSLSERLNSPLSEKPKSGTRQRHQSKSAHALRKKFLEAATTGKLVLLPEYHNVILRIKKIRFPKGYFLKKDDMRRNIIDKCIDSIKNESFDDDADKLAIVLVAEKYFHSCRW